MTSVRGSLRRRLLTPDVSATRLDVRGFRAKDPAAKELLETVGRTFLAGYGHAAEAAVPTDAEIPLERVPVQFRGFAYEGAAMGFAVRDGLPVGRRDGVERFLAGRADAHVYMVYVGIGWAMARLPRFRWPTAESLDPLLHWLVLDGYGFHQAYFRTARYVHGHYEDPGFRWPAGPQRAYANRAIDQGIGRALWFVGGTAVDAVADLIDGFPVRRRADLWSGAGLAATYAGGPGEPELERFRQRAGAYRSELAQGSAFGAEARVRAGLLIPHTAVATQVFCDSTPEQAARACADARPDPAAPQGELPAYETWRQRVADEFVLLGRC